MNNIQTRPLTREKLSALVDGRMELIKFFENLTQDVRTALPGAVDDLAMTADGALALAQLAQGIAQQAATLAQLALTIGSGAAEGPPAVPVVPVDITDSEALLYGLRERVSVLELAVSQIKEGPSP